MTDAILGAMKSGPPLIVMAYLVVVEGWMADDAMEKLRRQRRCIAPDWDSYFAAGES